MAKRAPRGRRSSASRSSSKPRSLALLAQRFSEAEASFRKAEADFNTAKNEMLHARADMLLYLGKVEPVERVEGERRSTARDTHSTPREGTLGATIVKLLSDGTDRGPSEVFDAIRSMGRKSKGSEKSQRVMVAQTLSKLARSGAIRKKSRGVYGK